MSFEPSGASGRPSHPLYHPRRRDRASPKSLGLAGSAGLSLTHWRHVQADLVNRLGFPPIANLGTTRLCGLEANLDSVPLSGLRIAMAVFLNDARTPIYLRGSTATWWLRPQHAARRRFGSIGYG